jgi:hypothetical protein
MGFAQGLYLFVLSHDLIESLKHFGLMPSRLPASTLRDANPLWFPVQAVLR